MTKPVFRISEHAKAEMGRRNVPPDLVDEVMTNPQQIIPAAGGRKSYQSKTDFGEGRIMSLRAIVDESVDPRVVVTAVPND